MRGLLADTYREMLSKKFLILLSIMTFIGLLIAYLISNLSVSINMSGSSFENSIESGIIFNFLDQFLSFTVLVTTIFTAGLLPTMFEKGRAEYYLSKPISRFKLLTTKISTIWIVYSVLLVLSSFSIISLLSIMYSASFYGLSYLIVTYLLLFIIWLSVTSFTGLLFNSTSAAIGSAFVIWMVQLILTGYESFLLVIDSEIIKKIVTVAYHIFPKTSQISDMGLALAMDKNINNWLPLWSSLIFAAVMFFLANWTLKKRDF